MWPGPTLLCAPAAVQNQLIHDEIPWLQSRLNLAKAVLQGEDWPSPDFGGILLMDPHTWLRKRLRPQMDTSLSRPQDSIFPTQVPLLLDRVERLESWVQEVLTTSLSTPDWSQLQRAVPQMAAHISNIHVELTLKLLQRPLSPCLLLEDDLALLERVLLPLPPQIPVPWAWFRQQVTRQQAVFWADIHRDTGQVSIHASPIDLDEIMPSIWATQPLVMIGEAVDLDRDASSFRQRLGLPDLTALRFLPETSFGLDQVGLELSVYTPRLPVPNSPLFRDHILSQLKRLICDGQGEVVILVSDQPLQSQIASALAAEFGTRVTVNRSNQFKNSILVCSWDYWLEHRVMLLPPTLLAIVTLPFPSMEDPLVAARVNYLRQKRQDWFRIYMLPTAAAHLQQAVSPLRARQAGMARARKAEPLLAILDSRIITRSYGSQLLDSLGPILRSSQGQLLA
jgi:ATP-dependent DNA helicase DinG